MFAVIALALAAAAFNALGAAGEQRAASRLAALRLHSGTAGTRSAAATAGTSRTRTGSAHWPRGGATRAGWRNTRRTLASGYWFAAILISTPLWLAGWSADAVGFLGQAAALHLGSLSIVQPIMVTTLLFSLPLGAIGMGRRPGPRDWLGAATIATGLALILSTRHIPAVQTVHGASLAVAMIAVTAGVIALTGLARRVVAHRAALLSVAAGALFSVGAAATKLAASAYTEGGFSGLVTSWSAYALAAASVGGLALQQAGFASGSLPVAMTALVITDPLVSYGLGLVGFGEPVPSSGAALSLAAAGAVFLVWGTATLAHSPLLHPVQTAAGTATPAAPGSATPAAAGTATPASAETTTPAAAGTATRAAVSVLAPIAQACSATVSSLRLWRGPMGLRHRRVPAPRPYHAGAATEQCAWARFDSPHGTRTAHCRERVECGSPSGAA